MEREAPANVLKATTDQAIAYVRNLGAGEMEFLCDPRNRALLVRMRKCLDAGDRAAREALWNEYAYLNSQPLNPAAFGPYARIARTLLARLADLGVEVRETEPQFLWGRGRYPQSRLGACATTLGRGAIFIDCVGPNLASPLELLDTLLHQAIWATGPFCGRWPADRQPSAELGTHYFARDYLVEEAVAICGADMLHADRGSRPSYDRRAAQQRVNEVAATGKAAAIASGAFARAEGAAEEAVALLLVPPSRHARLRVWLRGRLAPLSKAQRQSAQRWRIRQSAASA